MIAYIWPLALVVLSNTIYHICAKSLPDNANPLASLTITYLVGAVVSFVLFLIFNKNANFVTEFNKMNWAPFILGVVIVGLEFGYIYAYKAGWPVSTASIVQSVVLAFVLILVGLLFFKEQITLNKIIGVVICLVGLIVINLK